MEISNLKIVPHATATVFCLSCSTERYLLRSTDHKTPRYAVFSIPPLPRPPWAKTSTFPPYSLKHSVRVAKIHTHINQKEEIMKYIK